MKKSKADVNYRQGSQRKCCELCTMFRGPNGCTAVQGAVSAAGVCDLFEKRGS